MLFKYFDTYILGHHIRSILLDFSSDLSSSIYRKSFFIYLKPHLYIFCLPCFTEQSSVLTKTMQDSTSHRLSILTSSTGFLWAQASSQAACPTSTWEGSHQFYIITVSSHPSVPCPSLQCQSVDCFKRQSKWINLIAIAGVVYKITCLHVSANR